MGFYLELFLRPTPGGTCLCVSDLAEIFFSKIAKIISHKFCDSTYLKDEPELSYFL